jgi:hypothetical protein
LPAVFQSPEPALASHVALPARAITGTNNIRPLQRQPRRNSRAVDELLQPKNCKSREYIESLFLLPAVTLSNC